MVQDHAPAATTQPTHDRRRFLSALAGGLAALGLRSVGSAPSAQAADGDALLVGRGNTGTTQTDLFVDVVGAAALVVLTSGSSTNSVAVQGMALGSNGSGVIGSGNIGVLGTSTTGAGLFGESTTSAAVGVIAKADISGGLALRVEGFPQFFGTSGRVIVPAGKKAVSVSLPGVVPTDTVLATLQGTGAISVKNAVAHADKISIAISKVSNGSVSVGYLVIRT